MISQITAAELEQLIPVARDFHRRMKLPGVFNDQVFLGVWSKLLDGLGFVMARTVAGEPVEAMGMVISGDTFSELKTAVLSFWLFPESPSGLSGGLLFARAEEECVKRGVSVMLMSTLYSSPHVGEAVKFLTRAGYELAETVFRKVLPCP